VEKQTAAMDEIHASTINANCALTTTKHTKTVIMDFIKKVIILFLHLQKQVTDKKHEQKRADAFARFFNDTFLFTLSFLFLADLIKKPKPMWFRLFSYCSASTSANAFA
jgi:hypothetical protein